MSDKIYETHLLSSQPLPFVFHFDTVRGQTQSSEKENWHTNIELLYFVEGSGSVTCNARNYPVKKDDIFVVNSSMPHSITSPTRIQYYCLIIDDIFCTTNSIDTDSISFKPVITDGYAKKLFDKIVTEYATQNTYQNAGIKSAILNLMVYLARNYTEPYSFTGMNMQKKHESTKIAISYIKAHFNQKLTLEDIAYQAGFSKYYFLRMFKSVTGYTPIAYINKIRCENAKNLLLSGEANINEIGEKVGFDNFSYFSKKFKESEGCTPSEFIKKHSIN